MLEHQIQRAMTHSLQDTEESSYCGGHIEYMDNYAN